MDRRLGLRSASVGAKPRSTGPRAPPIVSVDQLQLVGRRTRGCDGSINDLHRLLLPQAVQVDFKMLHAYSKVSSGIAPALL